MMCDVIIDHFEYGKLVKVTYFPLICIYFHPADYPEKYVARVFDLDDPTNLIAVADSLDQIEKKIPKEMWRISRSTKDDPCIVETWI